MTADNQEIVLALESSGGGASAAISRGGVIIAHRTHMTRHGQAAVLIPLMRDALAEAGVEAGQCAAILGGRGPGSFTGIRVALAAAKGLGLATGRPAYGLRSLRAMAHAAHVAAGGGKHEVAGVAAVADSRRGSLFLEMLTADGRPLAEPCDCTLDEIIPRLDAARMDAAGMDVGGIDAGGGAGWLITGHVAMLAGLKGLGRHRLMEAEPDATHLCALFASLDKRDNLPLTPLYLAPPLLGPPLDRDGARS